MLIIIIAGLLVPWIVFGSSSADVTSIAYCSRVMSFTDYGITNCQDLCKKLFEKHGFVYPDETFRANCKYDHYSIHNVTGELVVDPLGCFDLINYGGEEPWSDSADLNFAYLATPALCASYCESFGVDKCLRWRWTTENVFQKVDDNVPSGDYTRGRCVLYYPATIRSLIKSTRLEKCPLYIASQCAGETLTCGTCPGNDQMGCFYHSNVYIGGWSKCRELTPCLEQMGVSDAIAAKIIEKSSDWLKSERFNLHIKYEPEYVKLSRVGRKKILEIREGQSSSR